jgi:putative hydroxymethylpyrimidine transport system permease protein
MKNSPLMRRVIATITSAKAVIARLVRGTHAQSVTKMDSTQTSSALSFRIIISTAILLLLWQGAVSLWHLPSFILPTPKELFVTLYQQRALLMTESLPTLLEIFLGLLLGVLCGCIGGAMTVYFRPLKTWLLPLLILSQAIPTFVIAPLLVIWFGYGLTAKIITSMLMIFFPVASATYDGLHQTSSEWLALAHTMNARPMSLFVRVRLPAALPAIASGIRIAAVAAPLGAIVGEWVGASHGLGYLMLNANARMDIAQMFAAVILLIFISLLLYFSVDIALKKIVWWE